MEYTYIIFLIGVITIVYASLSTLRTIDIKELIAYSSVSHAAVYLLGVFSNSIQGIEGAITLGIAHGFVSPGLFICAGGVLYDRSHTRVISFYRGVAQVMPLFAILFFILCLANCGAPLTLNFIGEFLSLYGVFERSSLYGLFASSSIIFSAAYTIYMFQRIAFGGAYSRMFTVVMPDLTKREFTILMLLAVPTVILGIYPALILDGLSYAVSLLLYNSDIIAGLSSAPFTTEQKNLLDRADNFDRNAMDNISGVTSLRDKSNDSIEVLKTIVESEKDKIKATQESLAEELKTAMQQNPNHSDDFEERIYTNKDTSTQAISELNSAADVAVDQITDGQPITEAFLVIVTDIAALELLSSLFVVLSVLLQLYLNKTYRHCIYALLNSLKY